MGQWDFTVCGAIQCHRIRKCPVGCCGCGWLVHTDSDFIAGGVARHSHVELPCTCHQKWLYVNNKNVHAYTENYGSHN